MRKLIIIAIIVAIAFVAFWSLASRSQGNEDIICTIRIEGVNDFDAANYDIFYNPDLLEVVDVLDGDINGTPIPVSRWEVLEPGKLRILNNIPGLILGVSGDGYLSQVLFKIIGSGSTYLSAGNGMVSNYYADEVFVGWEGKSLELTKVSIEVKKR